MHVKLECKMFYNPCLPVCPTISIKELNVDKKILTPVLFFSQILHVLGYLKWILNICIPV
jgi:hypothetical protein